MILVTDSEMRQALACIRSLGRRGLAVAAGDSVRLSLGRFSRYAKKSLTYRDPEQDEEGFVEDMIRIVDRYGITEIIPIRDKCLIPLARYRDRLPETVRILCPPYDTIMVARDKQKTIELAQRLRVPAPNTIFALDEKDISSVSVFPVIIKPAMSSGSRGLVRCDDILELKKAYRMLKRRYRSFLVQDIMDGDEVGFYCLYDNGKLLAYTMHKRLRAYPKHGGPSTLRETVHIDELKGYATKLLDELRWHGPAMVEFKHDTRSGLYKLMEINPRLWGSLALDLAAGVDYPYMMHQLALGEKIVYDGYKAGVKARWLLPGDLLWLLSTRFRGLFRFIRTRADAYDIVAKDDLMPVIGFFVCALSYLTPRKLRYVFR